MIEFAALIIGTVTTSIIALVVFAKNFQSITNKLFIGLAIGLVGWSITTYLSLHTVSDAETLFWIRWIMFFVVFQNTSFLLLVSVFPLNKFNLFKQKRYAIAILYSMITAIIAVSPYLFVGFRDGAPVPGPGMLLFVPHALVFAVGGLITLMVRVKRSHGIEKAQLQYVLAGTLLMFTLVPVGNFIIPVVFKLNQFVIFSPLYSIVFSGLIAYAIAAQKLFDIRAAVARSLTYVLLLASLASLYSASIFGISTLLLSNQQLSYGQNLINIALAVVLAFTFQPLRRFFEKLTDRIFYRDRYDTQEVLNKIGSVLASQLDINIIIGSSLNTVAEAIKPLAARLVVVDEDKIYREASYGEVSAKLHNIKTEELQHLHHNLLLVDELEGGKTKQILQKHDIAASLRLKTQEGVVGYVLLAAKQNGTIYTSQDIRMLEIIGNELAVAVQNARSYEKIAEFNVTLQRRVEEATARLRIQNQKLKELDAAKDEFISMASHQLRTPLTTIKGYLAMLLDGDAGKVPAKQEQFVELAFTSSERMVALISDMLNVSRISTGKFVIDKKHFDISRLVAEEVQQLQRYAHGKSVSLSFKKPRSIAVYLDEGKTRQVVMNLVDNAIYYTPSGGKVEVFLKQTAKAIEFKVVDNGIGVPEAAKEKLFTKFFRAGNAQTMRADGTGLGLYMAKKVVQDQGGSMLFESTEGKGSTFGFSFPLDQATVKTPKTAKKVAIR